MFGFGTPKTKHKGHADFTGYDPDFFDFNLEDTDKTTSPYSKPGRHFRTLEISEKQVLQSIDAGDNVEFARSRAIEKTERISQAAAIDANAVSGKGVF